MLYLSASTPDFIMLAMVVVILGFSIGFLGFYLVHFKAEQAINEHIDAQHAELIQEFEADMMQRLNEAETKLRGPMPSIDRMAPRRMNGDARSPERSRDRPART